MDGLRRFAVAWEAFLPAAVDCFLLTSVEAFGAGGLGWRVAFAGATVAIAIFDLGPGGSFFGAWLRVVRWVYAGWVSIVRFLLLAAGLALGAAGLPFPAAWLAGSLL